MKQETVSLTLTKDEIIYLYNILENNHAVTENNKDITDSIFTDIQGKLIAKLISTCKLSRDNIMEILQNKYCKENQFDLKPLFMGGGWHSINRCNMMHKRLTYATMVLGGKQQNGGMGIEFDELSDQEDEREIKKALRDVIAAFGYKPSEL